MTVIAYRSGIIAADSAVWRGDYVSGSVRKIRRLPDGGLAAASGSMTIMQWFLQRMETGEDFSHPPIDPDNGGFAGLVLRANGDLFACDLNMVLYEVKAEWFALGASSGFTAGCLAAGASADEAVRLTLKWTDAGRGDIQVEALDPTKIVTRAAVPDGWPPGQDTRGMSRERAWAEYWAAHPKEKANAD